MFMESHRIPPATTEYSFGRLRERFENVEIRKMIYFFHGNYLIILEGVWFSVDNRIELKDRIY